ncbi:MAG: 5-bromo-4-chloroindolyl phosphate hydrolysis family protein [Peptoniphilaceae bacterium]|nr:5-bromo-4-chloroindolyl phosphate hydrolysis family protein [Peptoniphilaceae bacterium]
MTDKNKFDNKIQKALDNDDFKEIGKIIKDATYSSLNFIKNSVLNYSNKQKDYIPVKDPKVAIKNPDNSIPILKIITGAFFQLFGYCGLIGTIISFFEGDFTPLYSMIIPCIVFIFLGKKLYKSGKKIKNLNARYKRYIIEIGKSSVITVRDLATSVMQSDEDTIKDLKYMIKKEYFKQSRLVKENTIFILNIETYKAYKAKENLKIDNSDENEEIIEEKVDDNEQKEYELTLKKGKEYIEEINSLKEKIKDREFFEEVIKLKTTVSNIFENVKKHPDGIYALRKFMDYYLPTSIKLIDSFIEFEKTNIEDEGIKNSMNEIKGTINTINDAFENLLAQLYEDKTIDVKTDIDTLNLLLKQEGLLDDDFKNEGEINE